MAALHHLCSYVNIYKHEDIMIHDDITKIQTKTLRQITATNSITNSLTRRYYQANEAIYTCFLFRNTRKLHDFLNWTAIHQENSSKTFWNILTTVWQPAKIHGSWIQDADHDCDHSEELISSLTSQRPSIQKISQKPVRSCLS